MHIPRSSLLLACVASLAAADGLGIDLSTAEFTNATRAGEAITVRFDGGTQRVNWNNARWSRLAFEARDWSALDGIALRVATATPRRDVGVALALQEADGSWHYHAWACDLCQATNAGTARFVDFRPALWVAPNVYGGVKDHLDENQAFDPEAVTGLALGIIDPFGCGAVSFTLQGLDPLGAAAPVPGPVDIAVSGRTLDINGTEMIPAGLFGHFPDAGTREMRIGSRREIFSSHLTGDGSPAKPEFDGKNYAVLLEVKGGDRYQPSMRLTNKDWEAQCRNMGASFGRTLAAHQAKHDRWVIAEWWNEPYLNWSNNTRKNFDPKFFDASRAVEGGPVHLTVDGSVAPYLRWTKDASKVPWKWFKPDQARAGRDASGKVHGGENAPPADVADGQTYTRPKFKEVKDPVTKKKTKVEDGTMELTAFTPWIVYDETQFTFWSGKAQLRHYNEPLLAFGKGLKEANPKATLIAGWDFRPSEDHWAGWTMLYQPTIDASIAYIDGVTDHDYGGDVTRMPANYEFVTAYGKARHGKFLYNFNTECGENSDPAANAAAAASMEQAGKKWLKTVWSSRKIVHALATVPDKARSFTFHWFEKDAEGATMTALRTLRGRLVETTCADPEIYVAAGIDGTDPLLPRPDFLAPGPELTVAIFNDHRTPHRLRIPIAAPAGTTFTGLVERRLEPDTDGGSVKLIETSLTASGTSHLWEGELKGKHLLVLTLPLAGTAPDRAQALRRQFFADAFLVDVHEAAPHATSIRIPSTELAGATAARLRLVVERVADGEAAVEINGTRIELPRANTPCDGPWIRDVAIDDALLKDENSLRFTATAGRSGWLLCSASIVIDRAAP